MRLHVCPSLRRWRFRILMFSARRFNETAVRLRQMGEWCVDRAAKIVAAAYRWPLVLVVASGAMMVALAPAWAF